MWIFLKDSVGITHYIQFDSISQFYYDGDETAIYLKDGSFVYLSGDSVQKIRELIRMSGASIKQIGE